MKQVTLEEEAKNCLKENRLPIKGDFAEGYIVGAIFGSEWQQERMFELVEEYNQMLVDPNVHEDHKEKSFKEWFEQFKKK
jgi:hypothetical protein